MAASATVAVKNENQFKDSRGWLKKSIIWKSGCVLFKFDSSAHVNPIKTGTSETRLQQSSGYLTVLELPLAAK